MTTVLHPQARILPVTDRHVGQCRCVAEMLRRKDITSAVDSRHKKLGQRIRDAQVAGVPYILIIGEHEAINGTVNLRLLDGTAIGEKDIAEVIEYIRENSDEQTRT